MIVLSAPQAIEFADRGYSAARDDSQGLGTIAECPDGDALTTTPSEIVRTRIADSKGEDIVYGMTNRDG